ncbi:MAG: pyruvate, phosphate dikinase [Betaproteobacteria bacterium]
MKPELQATPPLPPAASPRVARLDGTAPLTREEVGSKAAGINRMCAIGLPVPPAFALTTLACRDYFAGGRVLDKALWAEVEEGLRWLEGRTGRRFGGLQRPLLVSVRSGAAHSMPGMMDTILNVGINGLIEGALGKVSADIGDPADVRRRFEAQYRRVVFGGGSGPVPSDPAEQLRTAIAAVFDSWFSPRALAYRADRRLGNDGGTAVTVQAMVFGTRDADSGTGVLFSRNPITGALPAWGEWLGCAQGEEVVSGERTPLPLEALRQRMPDVHGALLRGAAQLEADARDIQDIEFTVESGRLWFLQTRVAKRSPGAAVRSAIDLAEAGLISREDAVRRLTAEQLRRLPVRTVAPQASPLAPLATGQPACPGVAAGTVVTDPGQAEALAHRGEAVILARPDTRPEDIRGIIAARALVTELGGASSHAAVVSRELGRPCVVGCGAAAVTALAGRVVTVDGASGCVWPGDLAVAAPDAGMVEPLRKLLAWAVPLAPLRVLEAGNSPEDAVDLDAANDDWRLALRPGAVVRGRVLEMDEGIEAAVAAGVAAVVVRDRLPAVLASLRASPGPARSRGAEPDAGAGVASPDTFVLLRLLALKGRARAEDLAEALGLPVDAVATGCRALCHQGLCETMGETLRPSASAAAHLRARLEGERAGLDAGAFDAVYVRFQALDGELKSILTDWQVTVSGVANTHRDPGHDAAVLQRLARFHQRSVAITAELARLLPRLGFYRERFARLHALIAAGEGSRVTSVRQDSYHSAWFELHGELKALAGAATGTQRGRAA